MNYTKEIQKEFILSDGTVLAHLSKQDLLKMRNSAKEIIAVMTRTPHYRRKNRSAWQLHEDNVELIDKELRRRGKLDRFCLGGLDGYIDRYYEPQLLHEIKDIEGMELPKGYYGVINILGKWHLCPHDRNPHRYWLFDSLYEIVIPRFHAGATWSDAQRLSLPGFVVQALLNSGMAETEQVPDPLAPHFPFTVVDGGLSES